MAEMIDGIESAPEAVSAPADNCRELWEKLAGLGE
jgi:hypothetical protein